MEDTQALAPIFQILWSSALCVCVCLFGIQLNKFSTVKQNRQAHWIHDAQVPRHGGVALYISLLASLYIFRDENDTFGYFFLLSGLPLLLVGTIEDFSYSISPKKRIFASVISSLLGAFLFQTSITSVGIPGIDWLLSSAAFSLFITIFAATVMSQSFNLIDGLNGLSSGCGAIAIAFIMILSLDDLNPGVLLFSTLATGCLFGFWLLNILTARLFLGDGGAYVTGHFVAWSSIIAADQWTVISPWALLLATAYPVIEILVTVTRRMVTKQPITVPDQYHFHHLINRLINRKFKFSNKINNSISSFIILLLQLACMLFALTFRNYSLACFIVFLAATIACFTSCLIASRQQV